MQSRSLMIYRFFVKLLNVYYGIAIRMKEIKQDLMNLDNRLPKGEKSFFFNAGHHKIGVHCASTHFKWRQDNNVADFTCREFYRMNFCQLVGYISFNFSADLKV